ncbi:MAG TPA: signal peptidase I, partial [Cellvibrionaceae bacterium]
MKQKLFALWQEYRGFLLFVLLMLVFRSAVADWNHIPSSSMYPGIIVGDRIGVNKLAYDVQLPFTGLSLYKLDDPARGEIVVFNHPQTGIRLVKRVVGVPGDTLAMYNNRLILNGQPLAYTSVDQNAHSHDWLEELPGARHNIRTLNTASSLASFDPVQVPKGHYIMMGDNRDISADSRVFGFVPRSTIIGRASHVVMSFDKERFYLP